MNKKYLVRLNVKELRDGTDRTLKMLRQLCGAILDQSTENESRDYLNTSDTVMPTMAPL